MAAKVIEPAIRMIRSATAGGTINMNTNGSRPDVLEKLLKAGLDSVRISINSFRDECYNAYFRPHGYTFLDVKKSFDVAMGRGKFVSINYLNYPGFTDTPEEVRALIDFIKEHPINMIQWRNLNYDPVKYLKLINKNKKTSMPLGMQNILRQIRENFPNLKYGYFNPPKEKFR
jgi:pyruvate-formate lyase-activating enzyme